MTSGSLRSLARLLKGQKIAGGCDDCDAYQTVEEDPDHPAICYITIHHADTCPWLAQRERQDQ
jgi:hypothetical protein